MCPLQRFRFAIFSGVISFVSVSAWAQQPTNSLSVELPWLELGLGLHFCEVNAPTPSIHIDSAKISILKLNPNYFEFEFLTATEYGNTARTAPEWSQEFEFQIIANAGMYNATKLQTNKGYLKNRSHINNPKVLPHYNAVIALHPNDSTLQQAQIFDLTCTPLSQLRKKYNSFAQGMRMIDCNGIPLAWDKNPDQLCSMIVASTDSAGNFYFFFTRAPFSHQQMISFLLGFQLNIRETIYLEGGPEASLYINLPTQTIERYGTFVSKTWESTTNHEFWKLPNVIAIRTKQKK
jgi:hypothetical protein